MKNQVEPLEVEVQRLIQLYSNGRLEEARKVATELSETFPDVSVFPNVLGACCADEGQLDLAVLHYQDALRIKPDYAEAHSNLGIAYEALGKDEEALDCFRNSIKFKGEDSEGHNKLGSILARQGHLDTALECFKKSILLNPNHAHAHGNLARALQGLGRFEEAVDSFKSSLAIDADDEVMHNDLGITLCQLGRLDEAIISCKKAITINPNYAEAHNNIATALARSLSLDQAITSLKLAILINPNYVEAHTNLGIVYKNMGKFSESVKSYETAIKLKPNHSEAHFGLANTFKERAEFTQAIASYLNAIKYNSQFTEAYHNLGNTYASSGSLKEAIDNFLKAIEINPNFALAHYELSFLKVYKERDEQLNVMKHLLSDSKIGNSDRICLYFALSKAHDDIHDYSQSFSYLQKGNSLCNQIISYNLVNEQGIFNSIKKLFENNRVRSPTINKSSNISERQLEMPSPIFILGMPRSGTTLVEQILASHSKVYGMGELPFLGDLVIPIMKRVTGHMYGGGLPDLSIEDIEMISSNYLKLVSSNKFSENFFTDKMPANFRWIGFIRRAFPNAKIIHVKRDPRATCWSNYKTYFSKGGNGYSYELDNLAGYFKMYEDLMDFWEKKYGGAFYNLSYEELVKRPEREINKLLAYCGLDWENRCLSFHTHKRSINTASRIQVRKQMYAGSSEAWKKYSNYILPLIQALD